MLRPRFSAGRGVFAGNLAPAGTTREETLATGRARWHRIARSTAAGVAVILLVAAAALLFVQQRYDNKVYPAITAGDISLGGQSVDDARATLSGVAAQDAAKTVTLTYGDHTWTPTFAQLGVSINVDRTLDQAFGIGREDTA